MQIHALNDRVQHLELQCSEKDASARLARQQHSQQVSSLEADRDALNRRIRGLQKEMEESRNRIDTSSAAAQEAIAAAVAAKTSYIEDLKATDMRIISEVQPMPVSYTHKL